jgi:hypothetical protein
MHGIITDTQARAFIYSSESWIHHSQSSCRRLGLNKQILKFTKEGLKGYGTTVEDSHLHSYFQDVLLLCHQDAVSYTNSHILIAPNSHQSIAKAVACQSVEMVSVYYTACYI